MLKHSNGSAETIPAPSSMAMHLPKGTRGKALFTESLETWIAVLALAGILTYIALRHLGGMAEHLSVIPLYFVLLIGGTPLIFNLSRKLVALDFGSDLLAG